MGAHFRHIGIGLKGTPQGPDKSRFIFSEHDLLHDSITLGTGVACKLRVTDSKVFITILPEEKFNHEGAYLIAKKQIKGMAGSREIVRGA